MKKKLPLTKFEIVWYAICTAFALWGLTYIIIGLCAKYLPIPNDQNLAYAFEETIKKYFGLGAFGWGLIIFGCAAAAAVIVLCIYARSSDKEFEKAQRRAARLNKISEQTEVVDAKVEAKE